jgi:type IV pilus assembly protein PilB
LKNYYSLTCPAILVIGPITLTATSNDIQDQAISEGMVTMQMDGLIKSLRGITTVDEVLRATRE